MIDKKIKWFLLQVKCWKILFKKSVINVTKYQKTSSYFESVFSWKIFCKKIFYVKTNGNEIMKRCILSKMSQKGETIWVEIGSCHFGIKMW